MISWRSWWVFYFQGTSGVIQGTFRVTQGIFCVIQGTFDELAHRFLVT
jgi:hypothetical protein